MKIRLIALLLCLVMIFTGCKKKGNDGESVDIEVKCLSGTDNAYKLEGATLTFMAVSEETTVSITVTDDCLASY